MLKLICLSKDYNAGPIVINTNTTTAGWNVSWLNRMTNAVTKLTRLNKDEYVVENKTPRTPSVTYEHTLLKEACLTFFINADCQRVAPEIVVKSREAASDFIKEKENLKVLNFNIRPSSRVRQRKAMNKPVLIGKNKERSGILLGLDWSAEKAKVAVLDSAGALLRVVEIPTSLVWLP